MRPRTIVSVITLVLIIMIIFLGRKELVHAWELLSRVNLWLLFLLIPLQVIVYWAGSVSMLTYIKAKQNLASIKIWDLVRLSLELNFVNHVVPSGGISGISYMNWRLGDYGVSKARSTMAQLVRYLTSFAAFFVLLLIAVLMITIDGNISRTTILLSSSLFSLLVAVSVGMVYLLSSRSKMHTFSHWLSSKVNKIMRRHVLDPKRLDNFFGQLHQDYVELRRDRKLMLKPFLVGMIYIICEVAMFMVVFWSLGAPVNPAPVMIAYGLSLTVSTLSILPGGAGVYEIVMISFLTVSGVPPSLALAGVLLTRVLLLVGTIIFGYGFYQHAIIRYGHGKNTTHR